MRKYYLAVAIAAIVACAFAFERNEPLIIDWVETLGNMAPVFFLLLYCFATIFFLPTLLLTLAGGALFGPVTGTMFNLLGATLGAACAFCISRYFLCDWLAAKKNVRINNLINGVERGGWQFVALLRLIPIIPFNIVNYGLGITHITFRSYLATTIVFLIPTEIISTYCGYAGMDLLTHPQEFYKKTSLLLLLCIGVLCLAASFLKQHQRRIRATKNPGNLPVHLASVSLPTSAPNVSVHPTFATGENLN